SRPAAWRQARGAERPIALPPVLGLGGRAMLQNLSEEIRECLRHAEHCKQLSKNALTPSAIKDYLQMEQRWLSLAHSYEFAERLSNFNAAYCLADSGVGAAVKRWPRGSYHLALRRPCDP